MGLLVNKRANYMFNLREVMVALRSSGSITNLLHITVFLILPFFFLSSPIKEYKLSLAVCLEKINEESIKKALCEKINTTQNTYHMDKYVILPALESIMNMGWQKMPAGRRYNSLSGALDALGGQLDQITASFVYRNN